MIFTLMQKFWELAKQVMEFMTWKKVECPFERDRKILQYLLTAPVFSEDGKIDFNDGAPILAYFHPSPSHPGRLNPHEFRIESFFYCW